MKKLGFLLLCFAASLSVSAQMDAMRVLNEVHKSYSQGKAVYYEFVMEEQGKDAGDYTRTTGVFCFDGTRMYQRFGEEEKISDGKVLLVINHQKQIAFASTFSLKEHIKTPIGTDLSSVEYLIEKTSIITGKDGKYIITIDFKYGDIETFDLVIDPKSMFIEKVNMYARSTGTGILRPKPFVMLNLKYIPAKQGKSMMTPLSHFAKVRSKKVQLNGHCRSYQLINQL